MKKSDKEIISNVINQMITQDNRSTALPIYYQIENPIKQWGMDSDYADGSEWYKDEDSYSSEELGEHFSEYYEEEMEAYISTDGAYEFYDTVDDMLDDEENLTDIAEALGYRECFYKNTVEYKGMFLTEESAKLHLKLNHYHYSSNARTYVFHAWRNRELKEFLEAVARSVGLEIPIK